MQDLTFVYTLWPEAPEGNEIPTTSIGEKGKVLPLKASFA